MASPPPWWWQWGHGGPAGWRTREGVATTSCLSGTRLSAASLQRRPRTSAAGGHMAGGGGMLLQMGTPTPSRDPNRGQNWEGVVYTSWWPNIPTPACPTGVMGAVIAVGSKAAGCHHVKPGWEGVQVHAWTWFLPSLFWGGLGAKLGSSPPPSVSLQKSLAKPWLKTPPISACSGWSTLAHQLLGHPPPGDGQPWGWLTQGPASPLMVSASASLMKSWYNAT